MPEDKNATVYEVFREVVDEYSDQKGDDLLTDPAAVAAAQEQACRSRRLSRRPKT